MRCQFYNFALNFIKLFVDILWLLENRKIWFKNYATWFSPFIFINNQMRPPCECWCINLSPSCWLISQFHPFAIRWIKTNKDQVMKAYKGLNCHYTRELFRISWCTIDHWDSFRSFTRTLSMTVIFWEHISRK